jgi:hypothetical protein
MQRTRIPVVGVAVVAILASAYAIQLRRENGRLAQALAACGTGSGQSLRADGFGAPAQRTSAARLAGSTPSRRRR